MLAMVITAILTLKVKFVKRVLQTQDEKSCETTLYVLQNYRNAIPHCDPS